MIVHDLYCRTCGREEENAGIRNGIFPSCCGATMRWRPFPIRTDVLPCPAYSEATGTIVGSTRERDKMMRAAGFEPCGDRVGGARNESHLNLGKITSYPGQVRRPSPIERRT